jgi:hypothetical protein
MNRRIAKKIVYVEQFTGETGYSDAQYVEAHRVLGLPLPDGPHPMTLRPKPKRMRGRFYGHNTKLAWFASPVVHYTMCMDAGTDLDKTTMDWSSFHNRTGTAPSHLPGAIVPGQDDAQTDALDDMAAEAQKMDFYDVAPEDPKKD